MERCAGKLVRLVCVAVSLVWTFERVDAGGIIYVDSRAEGLGDGSSWTDAHRYLSDAIGAATAGDLNGDCCVDLKDVAILAAHWLEDRTP